MQPIDRSFISNTGAAVLYNGLAGTLILLNSSNSLWYTAVLFLVAGFHLLYLFLTAFIKIRKLAKVGFLGYSILSVFFVHIIFWLLFVNLP